MIEDINKKITALDISIRQLRITGEEYASAEKNFKIIARQTALKLKDQGEPSTFISKTLYGVPEVANLRFKRDVAEAVYNANKEAIMSIKLQLRLLESQFQREWGQSSGL